MIKKEIYAHFKQFGTRLLEVVDELGEVAYVISEDGTAHSLGTIKNGDVLKIQGNFELVDEVYESWTPGGDIKTLRRGSLPNVIESQEWSNCKHPFAFIILTDKKRNPWRDGGLMEYIVERTQYSAKDLKTKVNLSSMVNYDCYGEADKMLTKVGLLRQLSKNGSLR